MNFLNTLRGKALIISGPQGCGKTSLAVDVAQAAGLSRSEYRLESANSISHPFGLEGALRTNPKVVIVEDVVPDEAFFELAKVLASEDLIEVQPMGRDAYLAKSPIWIFTTNLPVELPKGSSPFTVITLNAP